MPHDARSGGSATVFDVTRDAFSQPASWLSELHRRAFFVGNSFFNLSWVSAPASVADRDGLGPLFNARSCSGCHFKDGRGRPPEPGSAPSSMLLRVSIPGRGPHGEPVGDPVYGDQIQGSALPGIPAEADVLVEYHEEPGAFADGERYSLRRPHYRLEHLGYGAPSAMLLQSPRVAPALIGLGLLEAVPQTVLAQLADPDDANHDGISGRQNQVLDAKSGQLVPGALRVESRAAHGDAAMRRRVSRRHGPELRALRGREPHGARNGVPRLTERRLARGERQHPRRDRDLRALPRRAGTP